MLKEPTTHSTLSTIGIIALLCLFLSPVFGQDMVPGYVITESGEKISGNFKKTKKGYYRKVIIHTTDGGKQKFKAKELTSYKYGDVEFRKFELKSAGVLPPYHLMMEPIETGKITLYFGAIQSSDRSDHRFVLVKGEEETFLHVGRYKQLINKQISDGPDLKIMLGKAEYRKEDIQEIIAAYNQGVQE